MPTTTKRKKKVEKKSTFVKELDRVFSIYIRKSYANDMDFVSCYTCGKVSHYKDMQNGHYISRGNMATRWLEENCRVQCCGCNIFKNGNYTEYSYRLLKEIGEGGVDELMKKKNEIRQWSISELKDEIKKYKDKIK